MKRLVIAFLPLALLGAGCNPADRDKVEQDAGNLAHSAGQAIGNMSIGAKVNAILSWHKDLDISGLKIDAQAATVTLSGHMPTEAQHKMVVDLVNGLKGVDKVNDTVSVP